LLLLHVRGAKSFDDLKTVDNVAYSSFQEAARHHGLLEDDTVWEAALEDAAAVSMPRQMRDMFGIICAFGPPNDSRALWDKFKNYMCEDFVYQHKCSIVEGCRQCENKALNDIQNVLILHGKSCKDFNLPEVTWVPFDYGCDFDVEQEAARGRELLSTLNEKQLEAYNMVNKAINDSSCEQKCFFLDGPGGAGKTYLYETIIAILRGEGKIVLPVASTGIAANLLPNGRTYHSQYKLPIPILSNSVSNIKPSSRDADVIRKANLLIFDEVTMASSHTLNCINRLLKEIMSNDNPFGGKVLLLGGDFRQCLPIVPHANKAGILEQVIKESPLWNEFKILKLDTNVRSVDPEYSKWILNVGDGIKLNESGLEDDIVEIPPELLTEDLVKEIFSDCILPENISEYYSKAILSTKNETVDFLNSKVLELLQGNSKSYFSNDKIGDGTTEDAANYPIEFLNGLNPSGMPPHELKLKIGAIIMLLRNLNTKFGLCNGTRLVVKDLKQNLIIAEVITGIIL
jgi:hypothetical protein